MNKLLTFLWIIILAGLTFLVITFLKPDAHPNGVDLETPVEEETPDEELLPPTNDTGDFTFSDYIAQGNAHMVNQEFEAAIRNYLSALDLNPRSLDGLIKLAEAYLKNNEPAKAEQIFTEAEKLDSTSITVKLGLARTRINQRDYKGAKNIVWLLDDKIPEVKYYKAVILVLGDDTGGAETIFKEIAATENVKADLKAKTEKFLKVYDTFSYFSEGAHVYLQTMLAKTLTEVGEYEAAIPVLFNVIEDKNNYRDAWIILGYSYLNTGKTTDAIDALNQARVLDPEKPETLFFLGLAYFNNNEIDKAIQYLKDADAAGFEPKEQIDLKLGDMYLQQENFQAAADNYEEVLTRNSTNMSIFVRTVWLNIDKLQNPKKAVTVAYQALESFPDEAMSYNLVGWALAADSKYDQAEEFLIKALELQPNFDAAHLNLGWMYEKQGAVSLAKEYYKKASQLGQGTSIGTLAIQRYNNLTQET